MLESQFTQDLGLALQSDIKGGEDVKTAQQAHVSQVDEGPAEAKMRRVEAPIGASHRQGCSARSPEDERTQPLSPPMPDTAIDTGANQNDAASLSAEAPNAAPETSGQDEFMMRLTKPRLDTFIARNPAARMLIYPRVSGLNIAPHGPHGENAQYDNWVDVDEPASDTDNSSTQARLWLAITQNSRQIGCTVTRDESGDPCCFRLYFDSAADRLVLRNISAHRVKIGPGIKSNTNTETKWLRYGQLVALDPGSWIVSTTQASLADIEIIPRTPWPITRFGKQSAASFSLDAPPGKRSNIGVGVDVLYPRDLQPLPHHGNTLLHMCEGETTHVFATDRGDQGGYELTRLGDIKQQQSSSVWRGKRPDLPGEVIVVKVIKPTDSSEWTVFKTAERWMQESRIHAAVQGHVSRCLHVTYMDAT